MNLFKYMSDLLFPPKCIYCGMILLPETRPFICKNCMDTLPYLSTRCSKCGGTFHLVEGRPVCATCKTAGRHFDGAVSSARYEGSMRQALLKYKYSYQSYMADPLSHFLANELKKVGFSAGNIDFVTGVPCDSERENRRGFDHAGLLAENIAQLLKIPCRKNVVVKIRSTAPLSSSNHARRADMVRGAYKVTKKNAVLNKHILLIDDIFTTGATAMEVSRVLKRAGAAYVFAATVAKTENKI